MYSFNPHLECCKEISLELKPEIALILSGGGIRAMVYHLGVLRYLAELGLFEQVKRISTVSGGSLLIGLLLHECQLKWPSSEDFLQFIYTNLREKLCSHSLTYGMAKQLINPLNWRFVLSRANLLSNELKNRWQIKYTLDQLPKLPKWSVNGTTAENGKRFRFNNQDIGDYQTGYSSAKGFLLADAMAVSAAFPAGIGPLVLDTGKFDWFQHSECGLPPKKVDIKFKKLHLYDGGVYDNLGLEPFFDIGQQAPKNGNQKMIVSDAGAPLYPLTTGWSINPWRLKRLMDIMSEQTRALRVRSFVNYLQNGANRGAYIYIATPHTSMKADANANFSRTFPTTFRKVSYSEFDKIAEHGYLVSKLVKDEYGLV